jgi:hypothetical protein
MQSDYFASWWWQKLIETLLRLMQPSAPEVPSKTPDVHFVGPDVTITPMECPLLAQSGHTELHCTCPLSG